MSVTGQRSLRAPAKINLGLRLVGVRDDGYHTLESVFCPIAVWDELDVEVRPGAPRIELTVDTPDPNELPEALSAVTAGADNLVVRAATAFCKHTGLEAEIRLRLRKHIPAGAGLGGGSSDAAAVLRALASLVGDDLAGDGLQGVALSLGADVPFFLSPRPSMISGIGEVIEPLSCIPALDVVVVNPGIFLSTAEVYRATDALRVALTQPGPGSTMRAISRLCDESENLAPALGDLLINDLEPAARRLCPPIARWIDRLLEAGAVGASMSGSGATVFGVFESRDQADQAAKALRASDVGSGRRTVGAAGASWIRVTRIITSDGSD